MEDGGKGDGAVEQRQADAFGGIAVQHCRLGVQQPPIPPYPPDVAQPRIRRRLAHGFPADEDRLYRGERRAVVEVDLEPAIEPRSLEQDRFLRQPVDMGTGLCHEPVLDPGCATDRAVDPFTGRRGQGQRRARQRRRCPLQMVAACQPAGGVHQDGLEGGRVRVRQPDLGAALLVERPDFRPPVARRDDDAGFTAGALQGRGRRGLGGGEGRHG